MRAPRTLALAALALAALALVGSTAAAAKAGGDRTVTNKARAR